MSNIYNLPSEPIEEWNGWRYVHTVTSRGKRGRVSYWNIYEWEEVNG